MPGSPYAVLKYWLVEGPTLEAKGDRKTSNEILFPRDAIDISVYLKKSSVHAILYMLPCPVLAPRRSHLRRSCVWKYLLLA